ncbi:MAG: type II toxin-antitoxin system VapC family toxin [Beijerinckiaceae bacterium]
MSFLFDTQILLWALRKPKRLSQRVVTLLDDDALERSFSVVTMWEVAIKGGLRRPDFDFEPAQIRAAFMGSGMQELVVTGSHAAAVRDLPLIHRDPFDRMLVAQAISEGLTLVTADKTLAKYPAKVIVM